MAKASFNSADFDDVSQIEHAGTITSLSTTPSELFRPTTRVLDSDGYGHRMFKCGWLDMWYASAMSYKPRWVVLQNGFLSHFREEAENKACRDSMMVYRMDILEEGERKLILTSGNSKVRSFRLKAKSKDERDDWLATLRTVKHSRSLYTSAQLAMEEDKLMESRDLESKLHDKLHRQLMTIKSLSKSLPAGLKLSSSNNSSQSNSADQWEQRAASVSRTEADGCCYVTGNTDDGDAGSLGKRENHLTSCLRAESKANECEYCCVATSGCRIEWRGADNNTNSCNNETKLENKYIELCTNIDTALTMSADLQKMMVRVGSDAQRLAMKSEENRRQIDEMVEYVAQEQKTFEMNLRKSMFTLVNSAKDTSNSVDPEEVLQNSLKRSELAVASSQMFNGQESVSTSTIGAGRKIPLKLTTSQSNKASTARKYSLYGISRLHRTEIPPPVKIQFNSFSALRRLIGQDLCEVNLSLAFSEPLSFLQRLTEELEYAPACLEAALRQENNSLVQLTLVAAYAVSCYASTGERLLKPVNPLLGETYELNRMDEYGYRSIAEQISIHPSVVCQHAEGQGWVLWREATISTKFKGSYFCANPLGDVHILFTKSGNHYTWTKATTTINNILLGEMWVENSGDIQVINHRTKDFCKLTFCKAGRSKSRKVEGSVFNGIGDLRYTMQGSWDSMMSSTCVTRASRDSTTGERPVADSSIILWERITPPEHLKKCYNFTELAVQLNEPDEGVAPTDSRLRPDLRYFEQTNIKQANDAMTKLERLQQINIENKVLSSRGSDEYNARWFKQSQEPDTGHVMHRFTGEYWECKKRHDWSRCPAIFAID